MRSAHRRSWLVAATAASLAALLVARPASAQDTVHHAFFDTDANTGVYAGVSLGESDVSNDAGALAHTGSLVTEGHAFGYALSAGYRPVPVWSAQLDYVNLGRVSAGRSYTQTDGIDLAALVYLPTPIINLYGRIGALDSRSYGRCACESTLPPIPFGRRSLNLAYGVGATTNGRGNLNLRVEWQRFELNGTANGTHAADFISVGLIWSFF